MGHDARKPVVRDLRPTKAQTTDQAFFVRCLASIIPNLATV